VNPNPVIIPQERRSSIPSMSRLTPLCLLLPLLILLPACTPPLTPVPTPSPTATLPTPTATPYPPGFTPSPLPPPNRTTYTINAVLDYAALTLTARETIIYLNDTPDTLTGLILVVDANLQPGVFTLDELRWGQSLAPIPAAELDAGLLRIPLLEPLPPGGVLALELAFTLHIPAAPGKLGVSGGQLNLGDWYPFLPAYRTGASWLAYAPSPVGETISYDLADYQITLELQNAPEGLVAVAGLSVSRVDDVFSLHGEGFRNAAISLNTGYSVFEQDSGQVRVRSVVPSYLDIPGQAALRAAAEAVQVYGGLFGAYWHASLTVVAGNFPDGLEYDGLVFVGEEWYRDYDGGSQNYLTLLAAHETAHQWWYAQVGNDQALEPWLDEALATYSELLWLERARPDLVDWWWAFRVAEFAPEGAVGGTVYDFAAFRPYVNAVYLRGALMLDDLRATVGDEVFLFALRAYAEQFRGREATGEDLIGLLEDFSGVGLGEVVKRWGVEN